MIIERAKELRAQVETLVKTLDDEEALKVIEFFPNWKENISYDVNDRIRYNDILYKCLIAHTSQFTWNPEDASSLWTKVLIPDPDIVSNWEQPSSTNPYMKGDKVRHNEKIWVSIVDNNVWEPGVYGWEEVIE